jgi:hypothetical protein
LKPRLVNRLDQILPLAANCHAVRYEGRLGDQGGITWRCVYSPTSRQNHLFCKITGFSRWK